ncbi:hypothetical protein SEA_FRANKLIN22_23 [Microbacterium phage Franklin22]|uniref:holin n=1 Tax=Microbacterium phage Franklin22 TaxID=2894293 RepID=UPI001E73803A|nr:holin [Microbacterium phage Franklin22]UGL61836.1 hypothetical protein SEA_FRANKLIN22_23 [Microbacterium phage Franklin22]
MSLTPRSDYQDALEAKATQVAHPWKATLRTVIQVGIPALIALGVVIPQIIDIILEGAGESLPVEVRAWLLGAGVAVTAVAGIITRIMALPLVNQFLTSIGLGATPKA